MQFPRLLAFAMFAMAVVSDAQVPQLISYQGRLAVGTTNYNGPGQFKFALVNTAGTVMYWNNTGFNIGNGESNAAVALTVTNGLYTVLLGDATLPNMTTIPSTVFENGDVCLRVWFSSDGVSGFQRLTPDQRIAAVGYAMMAAAAQTVPDGAITSAKLATGAVQSGNLAAGAVGATQIADGAVGNAKLANAAVTITAGSGMSGGGSVSLGGAVTLTNAGVTSLSNGGGITVSGATGAVTLGSNATSANSGSTIVQRDGSGNFSAGTITANLTGSVSGNATSATTATNFSGSLGGDVTGTQGATVIAATAVTGKALTGFTSTTGTITATDTILTAINKLSGNYASKAPLASPSFTGTVLLPAGTTGAAPLRLQAGANLSTAVSGAVEFDGTNVFVTNSSNVRKTLAFTDTVISASQIAAGTITSAMIADGTITDADISPTAAIAYSKLSLTGAIVNADISPAAAIAYSKLNLANSITSADIADGTITNADISATAAIPDSKLAQIVTAGKVANSATTATSASTASAIVSRDTSGNFSAGTITATLNGNASGTAASFTGTLAGDVTGTQGATAVASVGGVTAANVAGGANLANAATTANTANTIVKRDGTGNFIAGTITANLAGNATTATTATTVPDGTISLAKLDTSLQSTYTKLQPAALEFVTVGNASGTTTDPVTGYGAVSTSFQIGKYEVTNEQYAEFLNSVARTDPNGLYDPLMGGADPNGGILREGYPGNYVYSVVQGMRFKPVIYVNWHSAIRFCNWLTNLKKTGVQDSTTTEAGAYTNTGSTPTRTAGSAKYYLPTENEWYKAAYHKATGNLYWVLPTKSDTLPNGTPAGTGLTSISKERYKSAGLAGYATTNCANFYYDDTVANLFNGGYATTGVVIPVDPAAVYLTDAGLYTDSPSAYGTFDQGGNAAEWTETLDPPVTGTNRIVRGGSWNSAFDTANANGFGLRSIVRSSVLQTSSLNTVGFRVTYRP